MTLRPSALLAACALAACASRPPPRDLASPQVAVDRGAPLELELTAPFGDAVTPRDLRGRVVLLAFVNADDIGCQAQTRPLESLGAAYDPDDLAVVVVVGDAPAGVAARTMLEAWRDVTGLRHARYALAPEAVREGESPLGAITRVPTLVLLNRAGVVARRVEGFQPLAQLEALVAPAHPRRARDDH